MFPSEISDILKLARISAFFLLSLCTSVKTEYESARRSHRLRLTPNRRRKISITSTNSPRSGQYGTTNCSGLTSVGKRVSACLGELVSETYFPSIVTRRALTESGCLLAADRCSARMLNCLNAPPSGPHNSNATAAASSNNNGRPGNYEDETGCRLCFFY